MFLSHTDDALSQISEHALGGGFKPKTERKKMMLTMRAQRPSRRELAATARFLG